MYSGASAAATPSHRAHYPELGNSGPGVRFGLSLTHEFVRHQLVKVINILSATLDRLSLAMHQKGGKPGGERMARAQREDRQTWDYEPRSPKCSFPVCDMQFSRLGNGARGEKVAAV